MYDLPIIAVVERNNTIENPDFRDSYIGGVCRTFEEARDLCANHMVRYRDELITIEFVNNGVHYGEIDCETGELLKEWFVMLIG